MFHWKTLNNLYKTDQTDTKKHASGVNSFFYKAHSFLLKNTFRISKNGQCWKRPLEVQQAQSSRLPTASCPGHCPGSFGGIFKGGDTCSKQLCTLGDYPNTSTSTPGRHYVDMILTIVQRTSFSILHNKTHLWGEEGDKKQRCFKYRSGKQFL